MMSKYYVPNEVASRGRTHLKEVEVAEWLNVSHRTLQGWRLQGKGPAFEKFGRSVRYAVTTIEAWVAERERSSTSAISSDSPCNIHGRDYRPDISSGDRS